MTARTDITILQEIVRLIEKRGKVPARVKINSKTYEITYLEDHQQRMEDAMRRRDKDRLTMLFGQLTGRMKYQVVRPKTAKTKKVKPAARSHKARS